MAIKIKVEGLRDCERALAELPKATRKSVLRRVAKKALGPMQDDMIAKAPDDPATGGKDLKRSVKIAEQKGLNKARRVRGKWVRDASTGIEMLVGVEKRVFYGHFQEFGTIRHAANPFARPAYDSGAQKVVESLRDSLRAEIDKSARRLAKKRAKAGA